jgi:hypothetical protein
MKYFIRSIDRRLHLNDNGILSEPAIGRPMWFDTPGQAYQHDAMTGDAQDCLVVDAIIGAETIPGLPMGAICADDEINKIRRHRSLVGPSERKQR